MNIKLLQTNNRMVLLSLLLSVPAVACCAGEKVYLWPEGKMPDAQPQQIAAPTAESKKPDFKPDEWRRPYIEWEEAPKADKKADACMIIISGGAYECCCDGPAFNPLILKMQDAGIQCVTLMYRTPRPKDLPIYQTAWEDGQRAVRLVRSEAEKRGFNPEKIGVMGCSAGSHLSLLLALNSQTPAYEPVDELDKLPCHVNWAVPFCPGYVLTDGLSGKNTTGGDGPDVKISPVFKFDAKTCPVCFFHGGKDPYSPIGSTQIYRQLRRMKVPAELHLDADRGHGPVSAAAYERALEFMRQIGVLGELKPPVKHTSRVSGRFTAKREIENLWPDGKMPSVQTNQTYAPTLEWFIPTELKTKSIQVIVPGGAYQFCNVKGEGTPVAQWFNEKGMAAVVVKYRCPRPKGLAKHVTAWQDAQRAIRMVRNEAPARGLDPDRIGIMGFSAGGHLTIMTATNAKTPAYEPIDDIDRVPCNVQWACPIYPAYVLTDGKDGGNARGGNDDDAVLVPEFSFDDQTPPMCFVHGDADGVAAMGSVKTWEKLRRMGIQCDLHTLAKRGHCFQMSASPETGSYTWQDRLWEFMARKGFNRSCDPAVAFTVDAELPAGNIVVNSIEGDRVSVRQDLRDTNKDWFYWAFRVKGAAGRTVKFSFRNKDGKPAMIVGVRGPVVSKDGGKTFAFALDGKSAQDGFTYTFGPDEDETYFYECHPYLRADWDAFVARHDADVKAGRIVQETHCKSRKGADVPRIRVGHTSPDPKYRVLLTARHHCSETMASWVLEGFIESFLADDDFGKWLRENVELTVVPFVDYDGAQAGDQGKYRAPHDHNRDYTDFLYPETKAITEWVMGYAGGRLDAYIDVHCPWIRGKYNEFVYTPRKDPKIVPNPALDDRFSELIEKLQKGPLRYRAADDLPFGQSWNKGVNYDQGWSSIIWGCNRIKGLKICRTFEVPFANANGAVVTPDGCRAFGGDVIRALREILEPSKQ